MFYGIQQSCEHKNTRIKTFSSKFAALKWKNDEAGFTFISWPNQKFHKNFRRVYEVYGLVRPTRQEIEKRQGIYPPSLDCCTDDDVMVCYIVEQAKGIQVK